jgi:hypothetical protein
VPLFFCCQAEALEELMGLEEPSKPATLLPHRLLEHRALDKLLSGFVAVSVLLLGHNTYVCLSHC